MNNEQYQAVLDACRAHVAGGGKIETRDWSCCALGVYRESCGILEKGLDGVEEAFGNDVASWDLVRFGAGFDDPYGMWVSPWAQAGVQMRKQLVLEGLME